MRILVAEQLAREGIEILRAHLAGYGQAMALEAKQGGELVIA